MQSLPLGTAITQPRTIQASSASFGGSGDGSATVSVTGLAAFGLTERGSSSTWIYAFPAAPAGTATSVPAAHDLLWTLHGSGSGTVIATVSTSHTSATFAASMLRVDIGDDGSWEIDVAAGSGGTFRVPVQIAGALPVRVRASASAVTGALPARTESYSIQADVRFEQRAVSAQVVHYGQSCGPQIAVRDNAGGGVHAIAVDVTGAIPNAFMALVFGTQRRADPIGTSGCTQYTLPVAFVLLTADPSGHATWGIGLPAPVRATLQLQGFPFSASAFAATDGVEVTFAD